jgi:hypothetical protein
MGDTLTLLSDVNHSYIYVNVHLFCKSFILSKYEWSVSETNTWNSSYFLHIIGCDILYTGRYTYRGIHKLLKILTVGWIALFSITFQTTILSPEDIFSMEWVKWLHSYWWKCLYKLFYEWLKQLGPDYSMFISYCWTFFLYIDCPHPKECKSL